MHTYANPNNLIDNWFNYDSVYNSVASYVAIIGLAIYVYYCEFTTFSVTSIIIITDSYQFDF